MDVPAVSMQRPTTSPILRWTHECWPEIDPGYDGYLLFQKPVSVASIWPIRLPPLKCLSINRKPTTISTSACMSTRRLVRVRDFSVASQQGRTSAPTMPTERSALWLRSWSRLLRYSKLNLVSASFLATLLAAAPRDRTSRQRRWRRISAAIVRPHYNLTCDSEAPQPCQCRDGQPFRPTPSTTILACPKRSRSPGRSCNRPWRQQPRCHSGSR